MTLTRVKTSAGWVDLSKVGPQGPPGPEGPSGTGTVKGFDLHVREALAGGGNLFANNAGVAWETRIVALAVGRNAAEAPTGYFQIDMPTDGTVIPVVGGPGGTVTVTGGRVPMASAAAWRALYYILPLGQPSASQAANFRLVDYSGGDYTLPSHWVLVAARNDDHSLVKWGMGNVQRYGDEPMHCSWLAQVDGPAGTPSLRTLGTGPTQALPGRLPSGQWLLDSDGNQRLFFAPYHRSFYESDGGHEFRGSTDQMLAVLGDDGAFDAASRVRALDEGVYAGLIAGSWADFKAGGGETPQLAWMNVQGAPGTPIIALYKEDGTPVFLVDENGQVIVSSSLTRSGSVNPWAMPAANDDTILQARVLRSMYGPDGALLFGYNRPGRHAFYTDDAAPMTPKASFDADGTIKRGTAKAIYEDTPGGGVVVLSSPIVTSLPGSPADGQLVCYQAAAGVLWHLRYNAASASAYKWEFIGGVALRDEQMAVESAAVAASTFAGISANDPQLTIPLAGDYDVTHGCWMSTTGTNQHRMGVKVGAVEPVVDATDIRTSSVAGAATQVRRLLAVAASTVVQQRYWCNNALTVGRGSAFMAITPVRVG